MCMEKTDWEEAQEFHGHTCPGLAAGYRMSKIAMRELAGKKAEDEELVAIVENDACGVDAVQVLTGCTLGKGNLIFRDHGKHAFTLVCRNSGQAVRVALKDGAWRNNKGEEADRLRERVMSGKASAEENKLFQEQKDKRTHMILEMPDEDLCSIEYTKVEMPAKAMIFASATCAFCGELVSESRARVRDGKIACIPCAGDYNRGW